MRDREVLLMEYFGQFLGGGDDGQIFRIVSQIVVESDVGFLEWFLVDGSDADGFADDEVAWEKFTGFAKDKVSQHKGILAGDVDDLGMIIDKLIKTLLP